MLNSNEIRRGSSITSISFSLPVLSIRVTLPQYDSKQERCSGWYIIVIPYSLFLTVDTENVDMFENGNGRNVKHRLNGFPPCSNTMVLFSLGLFHEMTPFWHCNVFEPFHVDEVLQVELEK